MILIINQHKGSITELVAHLTNYHTFHKSGQFMMVMCVDQEVNSSDLALLDRIKLPSNTFIHYNMRNIGLTGSRINALNYGYSKLYEIYEGKYSNFNQIIFGCTNSRWMEFLNDELHDELSKYTTPTLIPCKYINDIEEHRDNWIISQSRISISDYLNAVNRPDCTIMIPGKYIDYIDTHYYDDEKYCPEDHIFLNIALNEYSDSMLYLNIFNRHLQESWYNPNGMSATFSRKTILSNRKGFLERAKLALKGYVNNMISLTPSRLYGFMYDYVTLGGSVKDLNGYDEKSTSYLKFLYFQVAHHWVSNENYNHELKFIEDESKY